ncbi:MAG: hypothetical protein RBS55_06715 [Bacteroidales bacterium]|nr:hypothetical protein [Bacteroidales bacterium]
MYNYNFKLSARSIILFFLIVTLFTGIQAISQECQNPNVTVRFNNPYYNCETQLYCVDVELLTDTEEQQLSGMNIRFFYNGDVLEFLTMGSFEPGYSSPAPPVIKTGSIENGESFGFNGPLVFFNGQVQMTGPVSSFISTDENNWTKLFNLCFRLKHPNVLGVEDFCPSLIWDLKQNQGVGGYLPGDDGLIITLVNQDSEQKSLPAFENVNHFNWQSENIGDVYGQPVSQNCISEICGYVIPISNWSVFLAIGLMLIISLFIYKKRISG